MTSSIEVAAGVDLLNAVHEPPRVEGRHQAAPAAAAAHGAIGFRGDMGQFPRQAVDPAVESAIQDQARADSLDDLDVDETRHVRGGAEHALPERGQVGIVLQPRRNAQCLPPSSPPGVEAQMRSQSGRRGRPGRPAVAPAPPTPASAVLPGSATRRRGISPHRQPFARPARAPRSGTPARHGDAICGVDRIRITRPPPSVPSVPSKPSTCACSDSCVSQTTPIRSRRRRQGEHAGRPAGPCSRGRRPRALCHQDGVLPQPAQRCRLPCSGAGPTSGRARYDPVRRAGAAHRAAAGRSAGARMSGRPSARTLASQENPQADPTRLHPLDTITPKPGKI